MLILNYHRVGTPPASVRYRGMYVTPQHLAWQVKILKWLGFEFTTVSEGVRRGCPKKCVAITFDDGYRDNFAAGFPVLKKANVPATVYVVTGDVGKTGVIWPEAGDKVSSDLMTWSDLKTLEQNGWEIGSHAADHVHLGRRTRDEQKHFIESSWRQMAEGLGHSPFSFAYPYGSYNSDTLAILTELKCQAAVTIKSEGSNTEHTPPLELFRVAGKGYRMNHFLRALSLCKYS